MDYFKSIFEIFASSRHKKETVDIIHGWILDPEHREEKEKALEELWKSTEGHTDYSVIQSLHEVYAKSSGGAGKRRSGRILRIAGYAASVIIFISATFAAYFFTRREYSDIPMLEQYVGIAENREITLPDGTSVYVNSGSLILYPEKFKGSTRTVYLHGEADFKVKKNPRRPFVVRSGDVSVTALGTEFNIFAYPENNKTVTSLIEGRIRVECGDGEGSVYEIHPGEQVIYDRSSGRSSVRSGVDMEKVTAWKSGLLVFDEISLADIAETLHRRFGISFHISADCLSDDLYTFRFPKEASIEEIIDIMRIVTDMEYRLDGDVCRVTVRH